MKFFIPALVLSILAVYPNLWADDFFVACCGDNTILKVTGTAVTTVFTGKEFFYGMALDRFGNLYIPNSGDNNILKYTPANAAASTPPTIFAAGLNKPRDLAFDRAGNLYEVEAGGNINKFVNVGGDLSDKPVPFVDGSVDHANLKGDREPMNIAFDSRGNLLVSILIGGILKFSKTASGLARMPDSTPFSTISRAREMAFDKHGNLFVANHLSGDVGVYEYHNSASGLSGDPGTFATGDELNGPAGIAFDSEGNLYVTNWGYGGGTTLLEYQVYHGKLLQKPVVCGNGFNQPNFILPIKSGQ